MSVVYKPVTFLLQADNNLFTIDLDSGEKKYLTFDGSPDTKYSLASWSSDGSRIVSTKIQNGQGPYIWTMNSDGSDQKQLTSGSIDGTMASFSPDGTSILFSSSATGTPELWLMNIDGTAPHPITHTTGSGVSIDGLEVKWSAEGSFSPDGTKIAYSSTDSGRAEIWVMNSDGSDRRQITFPDDPYTPDANDPIWSPDGSKIVFCGAFARNAGISGHIFTINPDGSDRTQLTQRQGDDPSWSPDGQQIFFDNVSDLSQGAAGIEAWVMNKDGSGQRQVSSTATFPSRAPAITKLEAITVPDDLDTAQATGIDFQDIASPASATKSSDLSSGSSDDANIIESSGTSFVDLNRMWNENGDVGGGGDGDGSL